MTNRILRSFQTNTLNDFAKFYGNQFNPDMFDISYLVKDNNLIKNKGLPNNGIIIPKQMREGFDSARWHFDMPCEMLIPTNVEIMTGIGTKMTISKNTAIRVPLVINVLNNPNFQYGITQLAFPYEYYNGMVYVVFPIKMRWLLWISYIKYLMINIQHVSLKTPQYNIFCSYLSEFDKYLTTRLSEISGFTEEGDLIEKPPPDIIMIENIDDNYIKSSVNALRTMAIK